MKTSEELQILDADNFTLALDVNAVVVSWLTRTVNPSLKRTSDIRNDKSKAVFDFFDFSGKSAEQVLPRDVEEWRVSTSVNFSPTTELIFLTHHIQKKLSFQTFKRRL